MLIYTWTSVHVIFAVKYPLLVCFYSATFNQSMKGWKDLNVHNVRMNVEILNFWSPMLKVHIWASFTIAWRALWPLLQKLHVTIIWRLCTVIWDPTDGRLVVMHLKWRKLQTHTQITSTVVWSMNTTHKVASLKQSERWESTGLNLSIRRGILEHQLSLS